MRDRQKPNHCSNLQQPHYTTKVNYWIVIDKTETVKNSYISGTSEGASLICPIETGPLYNKENFITRDRLIKLVHVTSTLMTNVGHFSLKSLHADLVPVEKVRTVASIRS